MGNIRRSRGYNFEHALVERFNRSEGWHARRLGGSSTGLPDIVALNNERSILLAIEAKSGTGDILYVPPDQIARCVLVRDMFSVYKERKIVFAFKFLSKKRFRRKNKTVYEQRKLVEYFKVADSVDALGDLTVKCTYDGRTYSLRENAQSVELNLPDFAMPFSDELHSTAQARISRLASH